MDIVVINNPAAKTSGALTILKELLEELSKLRCNRIFYIIVSLEELKIYESHNIRIEVIKTQNFIARILWDNLKLKKYLEKKKISPKLFMSLQNTPVNLNKNVRQLLYFHQGLSVAKYKWRLFNKQERILWIYQNIFPFFIKLNLGKVEKVIVQTKWIKNEFSKKFKFNSEKIVIKKPRIREIDIEKIEHKKNTKGKYTIFYPATPFIYKNHKLILEMLNQINKNNNFSLKKIKCVFTFSKGENKEIDNLIKKYKLEDTVELIGSVSQDKVLEYYKNSDLMIFPSLIESFGLPLLEAQQFKLKIIAISLPYAIEVLENYNEVEFIKGKDDLIKIMEKRIENESKHNNSLL